MSTWKCISSGNLVTLPDDFHIVEEMGRNKSYERVVEEVKPVEMEKKKGRPSGHPDAH